MKVFFLFLALIPFSHASEIWKVEHSAILRKHVPSTPQYADEIFSSKAECESAIDKALTGQNQTFMRKHYLCFLAGSSPASAAPSSPTGHLTDQQNAVVNLGTLIVRGLFTPEQIGHNIPGPNDFAEFGGKRPDAVSRHSDQFGFIASTPEPSAQSVKPHQLPNKNAEKVCGQMKQLNCYSTRGFIGCCPKGFSYLAAPTGMAPMGDICATDAADASNQQCLCYQDNAVCINSKQGICYGCSEM